MKASKSVLLYEALLNQVARLGLPPELRKKEREGKRNIAFYQKSLFDEQQREESDREKVDQLKEELFFLQQDHKRLVDTLERLFPSYYQQKICYQRDNVR